MTQGIGKGWLLLAAPLALGLFGFGPDDPVPWPFGRPPTTVELDTWVEAEEAIADRERFEEFLEAAERGEDTEHMTVRQEDIDSGFFSLERLFLFGDALFGHEFRALDGYGRTPLPRTQRIHRGRQGGLDSFSCAGCHQQGGVNGAGSQTATSFYFGDGERASSAVLRNPPAVLGVGLVQKLAAEMSGILAFQRDKALEQAQAEGKPVTVELMSNEVAFGSLVAFPDGSVDTAKVEGVDPDLVVKPFGWKGHTARLRRFVERASLVHFGVQSHILALGYQQQVDVALGPGPNWWDPDNDGVQRELSEGTLTAGALYLAMLETPIAMPPSDETLRARAAYGGQVFRDAGCAKCHREKVPLSNQYWFEWPDTTEGQPIALQLLKDGEQPRGGLELQLYSDLKRHHMGERLAEANGDPDGIGRDLFVTRPLWGLAETAPYLHDGRALTIAEAVEAHGGEAQEARDYFLQVSEEDRENLQLFLMSLSRVPRLRVPQ